MFLFERKRWQLAVRSKLGRWRAPARERGYLKLPCALAISTLLTMISHADTYNGALRKASSEPGLSKPLRAATEELGLKRSTAEAFIGFDAERTWARLTLVQKEGHHVQIYCNREGWRKWDCSRPPVFEK